MRLECIYDWLILLQCCSAGLKLSHLCQTFHYSPTKFKLRAYLINSVVIPIVNIVISYARVTEKREGGTMR